MVIKTCRCGLGNKIFVALCVPTKAATDFLNCNAITLLKDRLQELIADWARELGRQRPVLKHLMHLCDPECEASPRVFGAHLRRPMAFHIR